MSSVSFQLGGHARSPMNSDCSSITKFHQLVEPKDFKPATKKEYVRYVRRLSDRFQCDPATLTEDQLRQYFLFLRPAKNTTEAQRRREEQPQMDADERRYPAGGPECSTRAAKPQHSRCCPDADNHALAPLISAPLRLCRERCLAPFPGEKKVPNEQPSGATQRAGIKTQ